MPKKQVFLSADDLYNRMKDIFESCKYDGDQLSVFAEFFFPGTKVEYLGDEVVEGCPIKEDAVAISASDEDDDSSFKIGRAHV